MKAPRVTLIATSVIAAALIAGVVVYVRPAVRQPRAPAQPSAPDQPVAPDASPTTTAIQSRAAPVPQSSPSPRLPEPSAPPVAIVPRATPPEIPAAPSQPARARAGKEISDPLARLALALVGTDPSAEQYWISAINDPGLSAAERKDLIEDLNEDGLSDPDNPSVQDLPLIESRIRLIEALAPFAMDYANLDAFREAYKDLTNMYGRLAPR